MQQYLRETIEPDPLLREQALRSLAGLPLDEETSRAVMDVMVCRALIDPDTEVASLALAVLSDRLARRTAPEGYAALSPIAAWLGPSAIAAMRLETRPADVGVWQRLVSNLCLAAIRERGPARLNALSVLRRLVLDGHLPGPLVEHAAQMLDVGARLGADDAVVEVLLACSTRVGLHALDPLPYRRLDSEAARRLVERLDPGFRQPPPMRVPVGWDDLPLESRPHAALSNPPKCAECGHVHVRPAVLCERCGYWVFVAPDTHVPPGAGPRPAPPGWVSRLRRAQLGPAIVRGPRDGAPR